MPTQETSYSTPNGIIKSINLYKGKRALIGDYSAISYFNTKQVLLSLGFTIDIIGNINEIINIIKSGKKYDVIFSNNVYNGGSGEELLQKLKELDNFDTPIILHSVTKNLQDYASNVGFDGFLAKPIKQEETIILLDNIFKTRA